MEAWDIHFVKHQAYQIQGKPAQLPLHEDDLVELIRIWTKPRAVVLHLWVTTPLGL